MKYWVRWMEARYNQPLVIGQVGKIKEEDYLEFHTL